MNTIEEVLSHNLREFRGDRTQMDVADDAGIPFRTYQSIEAGIIPRKRAHLTALATYYDIAETRFFLDPDFIPVPSNRQILEAVNMALMERDMLRNLQKQGIAPAAGSKQWNEMLRARLKDRSYLEAAESNTALEGLMAEADKELGEDGAVIKKPKRRSKV